MKKIEPSEIKDGDKVRIIELRTVSQSGHISGDGVLDQFIVFAKRKGSRIRMFKQDSFEFFPEVSSVYEYYLLASKTIK